MMDRRREMLRNIFERLFTAYGPQHWWPADTAFEVIVGAVLTQNTARKNVKQSIDRLRQNGLLSFDALCGIAQPELAELIRSSGYYNQKAKKLKAFCEHVRENWQGDLDLLLSQEMEILRPELLAIHGIGPETADSIVLYAAHQPSFVVDAYTYRVFSRHGWVPEEIAYEELREFFMAALEPDVALFQEYHALLVRVGHLHCRRKQSCEPCPLYGWTPE